ncbi:MAG: hypothetical protein RIR49_302 [Actinomycetota bacterium]
MNRLRVLPALALIAAPLAACGGDDEAVTVAGQWARTSPAMASMGAAYMTLTASDDDALVGVSVPAAIAASAEIHEMVMADMDGESMDHGSMDGESMDHGSMDGDSMDGDSMDTGAMVMQQIMSLDLPAGETVELKPGGYHVMLIDLAAPLEIGQTFDLTLDFEIAPDRVVTVEVRDDAP